jgi:hypothetical protein
MLAHSKRDHVWAGVAGSADEKESSWRNLLKGELN